MSMEAAEDTQYNKDSTPSSPAMDYPDDEGEDYNEPQPVGSAGAPDYGGAGDYGGGGAPAAAPASSMPTSDDFDPDAEHGRRPSVGQKVVGGLKKTGMWIKGAGIRFGHKVKNEDWGGEIKRGGSATGKAVKDSFVGLGKDIKSLGNKEERGALWQRTKNAWAKQWRLLKKSVSKSVNQLKDKDKRTKMFEGMKNSTTSTFKAVGDQMKGYKEEFNKSTQSNLERAEGVPSTGTKVARPPPSANEKYAEPAPEAAYSEPALAYDPTPSAAAEPVAVASPVVEAETNDYDEKVGGEAETKYKAVYNYDAGNEDEMSLVKGEIITATPADEIGWLFATNSDGVTGLIPANYVSEL